MCKWWYVQSCLFFFISGPFKGNSNHVYVLENLLHPKAVKCVCVIKFHQLISHLNHKNQTWPSDVVWWSSEHSSSKLPEWRCIVPATLKLGIQINSTVCHSLSQTDKSKSFFEKQWFPAIEFVSSLLFLTWRITGVSINRDKGWKSKIWKRNKKHRKKCECCQIQVTSLNVSFVLSYPVLVHNCTLFLCSLDVGNIDDQCRGPSKKEKDHLAG